MGLILMLPLLLIMGLMVWAYVALAHYILRYLTHRPNIRALKLACRRAWYRFQPLYWLRCHTVNRYHSLSLKHNGYSWGWIDRDHVILVASFNALQQYVEGEIEGKFTLAVPQSLEGMPYEYWERLVEVDHEIKALYDWWMNWDPWISGLSDEEENRMLHRLIDVRGHLWT